MKKTIHWAAHLIMLIALLRSFPARGETSGIKALTRGNFEFALSLYGKLAPTEGNLFFSPYSISAAMGMTYVGARENTAAEMAKALEISASPEQLPVDFKNLNAAVQASACKSGHKLHIANGLCLTGGDVSKEFKAILCENFDAEFFAGGLDKINGWVKEKTQGKIEKILDKLSPDSVCVLLNAIYFKGTWASQFKREATQDAPFRPAAHKEVTVPFMHQKGQFKLLEKDAFRALVMPYSGKTLSMVIVLPKDVDGLAVLEKTLTAETLAQWLAEVDKQAEREAEVYVPRFKLETGYDLIPPCQALGIKDAFTSGSADFRGMGWPKGELWIAQVKHKAFVDVNEEGTEAAGATAVEMATQSVGLSPVFRADHPFLFVIREHATGSILFLGRLSDPTKHGG
jgi:serpin B